MKSAPLLPKPERLSTGQRRRNSTLRPVALRKQAAQREYEAWSREFLEANPACTILSSACTTHTQGVHHVIKLSAGGARMPGPLATKQGQVFVAACNADNAYVEDHPEWARENGFAKRNPLRRMDAESQKSKLST